MRTAYLLDSQIELLLAALMPDNRRVLQVMLHTGLRVSDVLQLRREQLGRSFVVHEEKTGKVKRCGLPDWLTAEIVSAAGRSEWAFPSPRSDKKHRTRQAVWKDLKGRARALRIDVNVGTHSARKVYAVQLMNKYGDIEKVRRALNHDNPMITMLYAMADVLVGTADVRRSVKPRARKKC